MERMIKHTFVICAYKESKYLGECISSLKKQTIKSNIVMITSTPNSYIKDIASKENIPLYINEHGGIGYDWNFGIDQAKTQYVTLAHQDDLYFESYTEKILEKANKYKDAQILFSDYCEIRKGYKVEENTNLKIKRLLLKPLRLNMKSTFIKRRVISMGNSICCPAVTYNLKQIGNFHFETDWKTNLDWSAWERLSKEKGRFVYLPEILMGHRIHQESETSNTIQSNARSQEDLIMLKKFWPDFLANFIFKYYTKSEKSNQV